eukprot:TRINITY_DN2567_c1_g1_i1.p1 TRINITY_DN2567_c1_g1~~TRINITY_DN2567_c1_g1_i1.p1  ORF type:complete len:958 (+),score=274.18 TRINITY_DN2567_c1_g1_i1:378-2876(+)
MGVSTVSLSRMPYYDEGFDKLRGSLKEKGIPAAIEAFYSVERAEAEELKLLKNKRKGQGKSLCVYPVHVVVLARTAGVSASKLVEYGWDGALLQQIHAVGNYVVLVSDDPKAEKLFERRYTALSAGLPDAMRSPEHFPSAVQTRPDRRALEARQMLSNTLLPRLKNHHWKQAGVERLATAFHGVVESVETLLSQTGREEPPAPFTPQDLPEAWRISHWEHARGERGLRFFVADSPIQITPGTEMVNRNLSCGFGLPANVRGAPTRGARRTPTLQALPLGEQQFYEGVYSEGADEGKRCRWAPVAGGGAAPPGVCVRYSCIEGASLLGTTEEETPAETMLQDHSAPEPHPVPEVSGLEGCNAARSWDHTRGVLPRVSACVYQDAGLSRSTGVTTITDCLSVILEKDDVSRAVRIEMAKRRRPNQDFDCGWVSQEDVHLKVRNDCPISLPYFEADALEKWQAVVSKGGLPIPTYCCFALRKREGESAKSQEERERTPHCSIVVVTPPRYKQSATTPADKGPRAPQSDSAATWKYHTLSGEEKRHDWKSLKEWAEKEGVMLKQYESYARHHLKGIEHEHALRAEGHPCPEDDAGVAQRALVRWVGWLCDRMQVLGFLDVRGGAEPSNAVELMRRSGSHSDAGALLTRCRSVWGEVLMRAGKLHREIQKEYPDTHPVPPEVRRQGWFYTTTPRLHIATSDKSMRLYRHDASLYPLILRTEPSVISAELASLHCDTRFEAYGFYTSVCGWEAYAYLRVVGGPVSPPAGAVRPMCGEGLWGWASMRSTKYIVPWVPPRVPRAPLARCARRPDSCGGEANDESFDMQMHRLVDELISEG